MVKLLNLITILCAAISCYTTWQGLHDAVALADNAFKREAMPALVAIATFFIAIGLWLPLFRYYSRTHVTKRKLVNTYVIPFTCVVIFCSSTIWSVIGTGGDSALVHHMQVTIDQGDRTLNQLTGQIEQESNLRSSLQAFSQQFAMLSKLEEEGNFSNYIGYGQVAHQLKTLGETMANGAQLIVENADQRRRDANDAMDMIERLRKTIDSPETSLSLNINLVLIFSSDNF